MSTIFDICDWNEIEKLLNCRVNTDETEQRASRQEYQRLLVQKSSKLCIDFIVTEWYDFESKIRFLLKSIIQKQHDKNNGK